MENLRYGQGMNLQRRLAPLNRWPTDEPDTSNGQTISN